MTDQTQTQKPAVDAADIATMSPDLAALVKADADFNAAVAAWKAGIGSLKRMDNARVRLHRALLRYRQSVNV